MVLLNFILEPAKTLLLSALRLDSGPYLLRRARLLGLSGRFPEGRVSLFSDSLNLGVYIICDLLVPVNQSCGFCISDVDLTVEVLFPPFVPYVQPLVHAFEPMPLRRPCAPRIVILENFFLLS